MGTPKKLRRPGYDKLDASRTEIRLLVLKKAAQVCDDIHCELRVVSLAKRPRPIYNTISYVWGDERERRMIYLNGRRTPTIANAEQVLRRFRLIDRDRMLWLDALCINQGDLSERGEQVALMKDVYTGSSHNLIWLGEDDGFMAQAAPKITELYCEACSKTGGLSRMREVIYNMHGYPLYEQPIPPTLDCVGMFRLWERPWFLRLWVVQEAALPRSSSMFCGEYELDLKLVLTAAMWFVYRLGFTTRLSQSVGKGLQCIVVMWEQTWRDSEYTASILQHRPPSSLLRLLKGLEAFQARDPRDHVYGILGLYQLLFVHEKIPRELTPDYNKSLRDVLVGAMIAAFRQSLRTGMLESFGTLNHRPGDLECSNSDLPSWVLRLHRPVDRQYEAGTNKGPDEFRACGRRVLSSVEIAGEYDSILILKGIIISHVKHVEPVWTRAKFCFLETVAKKLTESLRTLTGLQVDTKPFALTLVAGLHYSGRPFFPGELTASFRAMLRRLTLGPTLADDEDSSSFEMREARAAMYFSAMEVACRNRCVFVTQAGQLGLGPRVIRVGDVAAVLWGFRRPVLLRPFPGGNRYKLCDEVYMHDMMDGKWADAQMAEGRKEDVFYIH
ncbi:hypothetical protein LTR97_009910 [Elasticomyces elasticus]|uniref:Heterokaryon incompatibility domain-containing protein n=1 Tax=Elasticomyces elasticus TaxID=574655 RepID=A0AAN7WB18_9PEZI|nr:hypothetical protein LTR97_009910 [Elasticomyces elasticus]